MPLKALMYHYVRPDDPKFPYFKHLHVEDFACQLQWLAENIGFADREAFLAAFRGGPLPKGVVLTFDDGFRDHHDHVLPELQKRGLWGFFFVPTGILDDGGMLDVHRVHMLLGRFPAAVVAARLKDIVSEDMLLNEKRHEFGQQTYTRQQADEDTLFVKRTLNYFLAHEHRKPVLDALMTHFFGDEEAELAAHLYMGEAELRALADAGMVVGSHSVSHRVMSRLPIDEQEREIRESFTTLEALLGKLTPRTFCYPYGGPHTFTGETEALLTRHGVDFSFAVKPEDITLEYLRQRHQALPRYDCNMFPHGQCRN